MEKKGDPSDLENYRGIFNVTKIRSILDKLVYNDIYDIVESSMSSSNIGARKNRNIRDHLFVINSILNEAHTGHNKQPIDVQIFDVNKCFDKLEYINTLNDLYTAGVSNDNFVLIANSNKEITVSIKLPWGARSKSFTLNNVEMQGTVLAPLKCSVSIDSIGKEALTFMHDDLYKYRNCIAIPPLSMIDDILSVSQCSVKSIKLNAVIESKVNNKNLTMSHKKCSCIHVGNKKSECRPLTINQNVMKTSSKEKYLGSILSDDGKISQNITDRHNKGMGTANQILCLLKDVHFGQYYFEMTSLFRNSMLINGILFSLEALNGISMQHIEQLEACDKYLLCESLNAISTTATEAFYLETGFLPIRFILMARRLIFYWTILNKPETELIKQVFLAQSIAPLKNDWVNQIKDDLTALNIDFTESEMKNMKKEKFKLLIKEKVREHARNYLLDLKSKHSKSRGLSDKFEMQPYLKNKSLSLQEKQLLFRFRTFTYECKANFRNKFQSDLSCTDCHDTDTQEHLLDCSIQHNGRTDIKHSDIFGTLEEQTKIIKVLRNIDLNRTAVSLKPSNGSHAHPDPI